MDGEYIYGDVLFIVNFSMDIFALLISGMIFHFRTKPLRLILGASLGAAYGVVSLFINVGSVLSGLLGIAAVAVSCAVAYGINGIKRYMSVTLLTYALGMLLGGIMTYLFTEFGKYTKYIKLGGSVEAVYGEIPIEYFLLFSLISSALTYAVSRLISSVRSVKSCCVRITYGGKSGEFECLVDTGNMLTDGVTGTPVIFIKTGNASFLPERVLDAGGDVLTGSAYKIPLGVRLLPLSTVSGSGITVAVHPEKAWIRYKNKKYSERNALLALDPTPGDYGGFPGLCPASLI